MDRKNLKETYATHKTGMLQMNIYTKYGYVPYHWHDEYEFLRIVSGECECIIEGEGISLSRDEAILIRNNELHSIINKSKNQNLKYFAVVVHPYVIFGTDCNQFYNSNMEFQRIFRDKEILSLLDKLSNAYKNKKYGFEMLMKSYIINIFGYIFTNGMFEMKTKINDTKSDLFTNIVNFIHINYNKKISLSLLKENFFCSESYIIQLFKKNTGKTPIEYINGYRIYQSEKMLKETKKTILDISLDCGFENVGYFIRIFKKQKGITPLGYRKNN